jgi:CBS domain-containing protein
MMVEEVLKAKGRNIVTMPGNASVAEAVRLLKEKRIGAVVISDDGARVLGILSERDIVHALVDFAAAALEMRVSELMTQDVVTCAPEDSIAELMARMTERRIRHLPVVKDGVLDGMVSIGDVVKSRIDEVESEASAMRDFITG